MNTLVKPGSRARLAFAGLQSARVAFYGAHYLLARLMAGETVQARTRRTHPLPSSTELMAAITALFAEDWRNVEEGLYPPALDWRQELGLALKSVRYLSDVPKVIERQQRNRHRDVDPGQVQLPDYYRRNFHFQTDGYLSERSAGLYDFQVEALFGGTAGAMRRRAFVPIARYQKRRGAGPHVLLDVGAGTGAFLSFVQKVCPAIEAVALDLSEPYLAHAQRRAARLGQSTRFLVGPVEAIPLPDASVDIVSSIYLFHELPPEVRAQAAREIARVLKPGGLFVLADSLQYRDVPSFDGLLELFPGLLHEPFYASYARSDLKPLFAPEGLLPVHVDIAYLTKIIAFEKLSGGQAR
ncbi:MAG: class I SAM-dependent methyltransferase [Alphaproteobacteria bacterium]|nr:class I SAM-dependent methyltransferase [Alphaproteobacteria bacterium]